MSSALWAAAEALLGARFRLQGRDAATGLDCVGVVIVASAAVGVRLDAIDDYALRGIARDCAEVMLADAGLFRAAGAVEPGDVGLFMLSAQQMHLALLAPGQMIHADAALRRVAIAPSNRLPAPVSRWRWNFEG